MFGTNRKSAKYLVFRKKMVTRSVSAWSHTFITVSKQYNSSTKKQIMTPCLFSQAEIILSRIQLHEFFSLVVGNLLMKNNTYTDKSSKVANNLHIQRAGTGFEPGNDTKCGDTNSSFKIAVSTFCLMPGASWRKVSKSTARNGLGTPIPPIFSLYLYFHHQILFDVAYPLLFINPAYSSHKRIVTIWHIRFLEFGGLTATQKF